MLSSSASPSVAAHRASRDACAHYIAECAGSAWRPILKCNPASIVL
jgi:hypothetical protein